MRVKQLWRKILGDQGEDWASDFLRRQGYKITGRNVRTKRGELDIVAENAGVLAFVEVKTRRGNGCGLPEEGLTPQKCRRLARAAADYIKMHDLYEMPARLDLVAINAPADAPPQIRLIKDAVPLAENI